MEDIPDPNIKCGECPCVNPCSQLQPPPPPVSPPPPPPQCVSPPPPRFVYTTVLTPPPPPRFHYLTGPPGSTLYPLDPFNKIYSINAAQKYSIRVRMILVLLCAVLQLL
ncbi:leucine-rich repeat extensin-like protein 3 [Dorcoceras hygrometricum]|uniref:Leucine-rich repeat extensin-like protein 3 n=1 Tax=Dorcoceras hygrometricum TaxID=472368 RepID=A0A2Z7C5Q3_9LAMI|nr:leucine-rich repeat extensin-like protein 3 [Dorcoceras hygrometricum]